MCTCRGWRCQVPCALKQTRGASISSSVKWTSWTSTSTPRRLEDQELGAGSSRWRGGARGLCWLPSPRARPRPRGAAAAALAEPRLGGSRPARASATGAPAEVGSPSRRESQSGGSRARSRSSVPALDAHPRAKTPSGGKRRVRACSAGCWEVLVPERLLWGGTALPTQQRRRPRARGELSGGRGGAGFGGLNAPPLENNNDDDNNSNNGCSPQTPAFPGAESFA